MSVPESKLIFFWVGWRDSGGTRQERRWSGRWNFPCLTLWKSVPAKKMTLHNIKKLKVTHCGCDLSTNPLFDFCRRGPGPPAVSTPSLWEPPRTGGAVTFPPPGRRWAWPRSHRCAFSSPPWASWCSPLRCVPQLLWGTRGWRGESSLDLVVQAAVPSFHPAPSEWTASLEGEKGLAKGRGAGGSQEIKGATVRHQNAALEVNYSTRNTVSCKQNNEQQTRTAQQRKKTWLRWNVDCGSTLHSETISSEEVAAQSCRTHKFLPAGGKIRSNYQPLCKIKLKCDMTMINSRWNSCSSPPSLKMKRAHFAPLRQSGGEKKKKKIHPTNRPDCAMC